MKPDQHNSLNRNGFFRAFVDHPASVNETYLEHALFAGRFAFLLFAAGCAALVHAVIPSLFETTASRMISKLYSQMQARH
jgi:hypothetical protein